MSLRLGFVWVALTLVGLGRPASVHAAAPEPVAQVLLDEVLATRAALAAKYPTARFLTFWDCDGTILRGDCSEGYAVDGRVVYPGLAQLCIEHGLATRYPAQGGFAEAWRDYQYLDARVGHWLAYPYLLQMLAGAREADVAALAREHFDRVLRPQVFAASRRVLDGLAAAGVENHIVTASAEVFVRGGSGALGVSAERIHGIRVSVVDGRLTHELVYPVTYADGKRERLEQIVAAVQRETPARPVFVLAAFGNSYGTDGAFLAWTAQQKLPAGQPVAVMFNGGNEPEKYRGLFRREEIAAVVGPE